MSDYKELQGRLEAGLELRAKGFEDVDTAYELLAELQQPLADLVYYFDELTPYQAACEFIAEMDTADTRELIALLQKGEEFDRMHRRATQLRRWFDEGILVQKDVLEAISLARDMIAEFGSAHVLMGGYEAFDDWAADLADAARESDND